MRFERVVFLGPDGRTCAELHPKSGHAMAWCMDRCEQLQKFEKHQTRIWGKIGVVRIAMNAI